MKRPIVYGIVGLFVGYSLYLLFFLATPASGQAITNNSTGGCIALGAAVACFAFGAYQSNKLRTSPPVEKQVGTNRKLYFIVFIVIVLVLVAGAIYGMISPIVSTESRLSAGSSTPAQVPTVTVNNQVTDTPTLVVTVTFTPAVATAPQSGSWNAKSESDFNFLFDVSPGGNGLNNFTFNFAPGMCGSGVQPMSINVKYDMDRPLTNGTFYFQANLSSGGMATISGNFAPDGKSASGTFSVGCGGAAVNGAWTASPSSGGGAAQPTTIPASSMPVMTSTPAETPTSIPTPKSIDMSGPVQISTVTANSQWMPLVHQFDGVDMLLVPPGCFDMGSTDYAAEQPVHEQCFDAPFWIDKYEVTQAQFRRLGGTQANASGYTGDDHPVEFITWFEARDFCELRDGRLPTEAEWEYAARGPDNLVYPWGSTWNANNAVWYRSSTQGTANIGSIPAGVSWVGALDMSGNVWEWTSSLYESYSYNVSGGRERDTGNSTDVLRVLRGGSWDNSNTDYLRAPYRNGMYPDTRDGNIGFRCARSFE